MSPPGRTVQLEVQLDDDALYDLIRDGVAGLDLGLVRMERRRHRMSELFSAGAGSHVDA